jgi:hypothetical protein
MAVGVSGGVGRPSLLREIGWRVLAAVALFLALVILAFLAVGFILFGRSQRRLEIARGASRTLNGVWDGTGDVTFSAQSWDALLKGKRWGEERVALVDSLPGNGVDHCKNAWLWHRDHNLL